MTRAFPVAPTRLASGGTKFLIVLFSVPHWVGCLWWAVAAQGTDGDAIMLPSWPAQYALLARNDNLDPQVTDTGTRFLMSMYMAWTGITVCALASFTRGDTGCISRGAAEC